MKIKSSRNGGITLLFTDVGILYHSRDFLTSQICLITLFAAENKILAKISGLTVHKTTSEIQPVPVFCSTYRIKKLFFKDACTATQCG